MSATQWANMSSTVHITYMLQQTVFVLIDLPHIETDA
jgi:hypothetical protein